MNAILRNNVEAAAARMVKGWNDHRISYVMSERAVPTICVEAMHSLCGLEYSEGFDPHGIHGALIAAATAERAKRNQG